ncbi:phosphotransferase enzyme family protein [Hypomontagnella monticulosa]|nr:phosphotransferase enzyme family protein [Hypomontagnella monticulosa]
MKIFPESSFFQERRAPALPSPDEIRALNEQTGNIRASYRNRPPPVAVPSLGLLVKYGIDVTVTEIQTQIAVRKKLLGQVTVPEVYGWTEDQDQRFIYMSLVDGDPLHERWTDMTEPIRLSICGQLRGAVKILRGLKQDPNDPYIGGIGKQPLNDIFLQRYEKMRGPFYGPDAVQQFQDACNIDIDKPTPITFTHNDLVACNILVTKGENPQLAAIIDWAQSGWYPAYWEYCKARRVRVPPRQFPDEVQDQWQSTYLPLILDTVDDTFYHPWLYFVMSMI